MGNLKCIKAASHRNKSRWPGTNQGKKSHQNPLESQPKCKAHSNRQSPPCSSAPQSMTARKHVLSSPASWEGDGPDSLEAAGQNPPWRALVKIVTGKVEVSWGVLVFPRFNWELNVTLKLWLPQRRGCCKPPVLQGDAPGALLPSGPTCPSSQHQQTIPTGFPVPEDAAFGIADIAQWRWDPQECQGLRFLSLLTPSNPAQDRGMVWVGRGL